MVSGGQGCGKRQQCWWCRALSPRLCLCSCWGSWCFTFQLLSMCARKVYLLPSPNPNFSPSGKPQKTLSLRTGGQPRTGPEIQGSNGGEVE